MSIREQEIMLNHGKMTPFEWQAKLLNDRMKLLTVSNPKIMKGAKANYISGVLMLAPAFLSGYDVCAFKTEGCARSCLNTAGRGGMSAGGAGSAAEVIAKSNKVQKARVRRTEFLFSKTHHSTPTPVVPDEFGTQLIRDINMLLAFAKQYKMKVGIRLNGTSDLLWERMPVHARRNIFTHFPQIQFYDYTKFPKAQRTDIPMNYFLMYSWSEDPEAPRRAVDWINAGTNVAMVFSTRKGQQLPKYHAIAGRQFQVIDADVHDLRFKDPRPVIAGLRAKGFARYDETGFVVKVDQANPPKAEEEFEGGTLFPDLAEE